MAKSVRTKKNSPAPVSSPVHVDRGDRSIAFGIVLATVLAYLPSFRGEFIWNDSDYVTPPELRSLSGLTAIWSKLGATEQYYPLLHSFFWVQHKLWGDHPFGYHLITLLLHAGAAVLFGFILRRLAFPGAWISAALFALHPVHVESVAWITEQKNTLSLVFYLFAAGYYLRYTETRESKTYWAAFAWFFLSLLCKTVTASLPAALLVLFWFQYGRLEWRRDVRPLIPWLATGAAVGFFTGWVEQHYLGAKGEDFSLPFLDRVLIAGRAVWFYFGQLIWPVNLNFIYPRWVPDQRVLWQWLFPAGVVLLLFALWTLRHRTRAPLAAFLFFIGSLFPVLGFVNLYGALYSFVWDHWQYLPNLGLITLGGAGLALGWTRWGSVFRGFGPALLVVLFFSLGALTWIHCGMFRDNFTLYRQTLAHNPSAWMAHYNLANVLMELPGQETEAIAHFEATLKLKSDYAGAHTNLGKILFAIPGRQAEAMAHYEAAMRSSSAPAEAQYNFAAMLAQTPGREEEAIAHYRESLRIGPGVAEVHYNFGTLLLRIPGRDAESIAELEAAVRIRPTMAEAHYNLGLALSKDPRRIPEAITHFEAAVRIRPDLTMARQILERWYATQGRR